jgi:CheY-like chemotaxis protein
VAKESEQKHILVVNDTVAILDLFTVLLQDEGYRVSTDGFSVELGEMLARIREMQPDLIVLDLVIMDEGKGWQLLQLLRMDRDTRSIPVIVCSAASRLVDDLQTHLDTMKVSVVLKPFDIDHLLAVICKALGDKCAE